ncbi:RHS repeat domain-containing protein [Xenorhabdus entomophaga]|uniref:RHS repeat domain-containing protein n=1 Tax=Xenorhabdus entomophaga TaxID=3136257 RepID=UPI0030F426F5
MSSQDEEGTGLPSSKAWTCQQTFDYSVQNETLVKNIQLAGYDQFNLTAQRIQSRFSGKLWHEIDTQKRKVQYDYDDIGRITKLTNNADTDYAREITYAYSIEKNGSLTTVQTDTWGNQLRTRFDGLGRPYQQEILEKGKEEQGWQLVQEAEYDSWGRVVTQIGYDWLPVDTDKKGNSQGEENITQIISHQRFEYDNWGQRHRIIQNTGKCIQQDYDPVTRTAKYTIQAEGLPLSQQTVVYDKCQRPIIVTLYDSQQRLYNRQTHHYDGLGRLRATIDVLGQKTEYTYDSFGRVSTIKHSDGTVIRKTYAPFIASNLLTQIEVNDHVLGTRSFDSLQRLISTTSGGRTYQYIYQGSSLYPSQITDPQGQTVTYDYEPLLGNATTKIDAGGIVQRFGYNTKTGVMTQAEAVGMAIHNMSYTASGHLDKETFRFDDAGTGTEREACYTYSPTGSLTAYRDVAGKNRRMRFDKFGRPIALRDADIDVTLTYDAADRIIHWKVHDQQHNQTLTTSLTFDDFSREITRQIKTETDTLTIAQTYTIRGQIASRTTCSQQSGLLRQETYTYDPARSWLTAYHCSGTDQPRDAYGTIIASQTFSYDILGNMLTCITVANDGSSDTATFTYSETDPCQLLAITHTHPIYPANITLVYDKSGRLIQDEAGRHLTYDALGRLTTMGFNNQTSAYYYDATNRLVLQRIGTDKTHELYYQGEYRAAEILRESGDITRLLRTHGGTVACITDNDTNLLGTDEHHNVLLSHRGDGTETHYRYSPYGQQVADERAPVPPAYNGECLDRLWGTYHLGNGYRTYDPVLMRFTAPDSLSPFGAGSINSYAYCLGDPINRNDPSGHMSLGSIFGLLLGTAGIIAGVISAIPSGGASLALEGAIIAGLGLSSDVTGVASILTEDNNPQASSILGWISMGLGVVSLGASALKGIVRGMQQVGEQLITSFRSSGGLSGRGSAEAPMINSAQAAFQRAVNKGWVQEIEHPAGSGFHTLQLTISSIEDEWEALRVINEDCPFLTRLGFNPGLLVSQIDNSVVSFGRLTYVDIKINTADNLYMRFIDENTDNAVGRVVIKLLSDDIHLRLNPNASMYFQEYTPQYINTLESLWTDVRLTENPSAWLAAEAMYQNPTRPNLNNLNMFQFYNRNIFSGLQPR